VISRSRGLDFGGHALESEQTGTWRLRCVVALDDPRPCSNLLLEFEGRLEEIHEQASCPIQAPQRFDSLRSFEPVVADEAPHDSPVLLLHPRLIILVVGPRTGELDSSPEAVAQELFIEELRAVIDVESGQPEWKAGAQPVDGFDHEASLTHKEGKTLGPAAGNIGQGECVNEAPRLRRRRNAPPGPFP